MLSKAITIATRAHRNQVRKNTGLPYIVHPMEVMTTLLQMGVTDERTLAAAVLHDVIEDCHEIFHMDILVIDYRLYEMVKALTKEGYLTEQKLYDADENTQLVKLADIYSNIRDSSDKKYLKKKLKQMEVLSKVYKHKLYNIVRNRIYERMNGL